MSNALYRQYGKRAVDIFGSVLLLLSFFPLMVVIAIAVKLTSRCPIFSARKVFTMWKFRSMVVHDETQDNGMVSYDGPRFTPIGGFIRASHLDELPEFWHMLAGDMSLVGPRPRPENEYQLYYNSHKGQEKRMFVKPGITGLEQIFISHPNSAHDFTRSLKYDLLYVRNVRKTSFSK